MATKKPTPSVDEAYDSNAEASRRNGVRPKGTAPPPSNKGKVTVTHKKSYFNLTSMSKYQLAVIVADTVGGMAFIYFTVDNPTYQAHLMWSFGLAHALAMVPSFFHKRE